MSIGHNHPTPKGLNDVVRKDGVAARWYSLGLQLLDDSNILDRIRLNNQGDVEFCCNQMFKKWLEMKPDASWDQLIAVLIKLDLKTAANQVTTCFAIAPKAGKALDPVAIREAK